MANNYSRYYLAQLINQKLTEQKEALRAQFQTSNQIKTCYLDELLPDEIAQSIYKAFPEADKMREHHSLREYKKVAAQMDLYNPLLEEIIYAFQQPEVVAVCEYITGIKNMHPDEKLYAGGISLMAKGNFLNPHLDNSHDNNREKYRVLNLLYYVSPGWKLENGGNLELWDLGMNKPQRTIVSAFNRLALMITNKTSVHSVSKVTANAHRCCISNYYFSDLPVDENAYFHVTSFYGRPEEAGKKIILTVDRKLRNAIRKITGKRIVPTKHIYKK